MPEARATSGVKTITAFKATHYCTTHDFFNHVNMATSLRLNLEVPLQHSKFTKVEINTRLIYA